jgi:hypothetical protein
MKIKFLLGLMIAAAFGFATMRPANAETIDTDTYLFQSLDDLALNGTGLGNYNVILFANASGGSGNDGGSVNVDNSNTLLPTGGTSSSGSLFWMVSVADLQAFYNQQFGSGTINNIVLFLDLNETGGAGESVTITGLNIYQNATTTPTSLDPTGSNDLTSTQQNNITGFTSGTLLAQLSTASQSLSQKDVGQGIDDWSIFTFIDPFDPSLLPTDTLLFQIMMTDLAAGGELLSISGSFSACDITPQGCGTTSSGTTDGSSTTTTTGSTDGTSTTTTTGSTDGTSTTTTTGSSTSGESSGSTTTTTTGTGSTGTNSTGATTGTSGDSSGSTEIPEPASFLLLGAGLVAVARMTRKKRD